MHSQTPNHAATHKRNMHSTTTVHMRRDRSAATTATVAAVLVVVVLVVVVVVVVAVEAVAEAAAVPAMSWAQMWPRRLPPPVRW